MRGRAHADTAARGLGRAARWRAWGDAVDATGLVHDTRLAQPASVSSTVSALVRGEDPVTAARSWIDSTGARARWSAEADALVETLLQRAQAHVRELDLLAGDAAANAASMGTVSVDALARVEAMSQELAVWSTTLRATLEGEADTERLRAAAAAAASADFARVVSALSDRA